MRMNQDERRFDFHGLGAALKRAREEKGWTQAYVAELVDRDSRTIMNIENKGQYPSFDLFVKLITMFDVSVDQFIHADGGARSSSCRKHIDVLLNSMNEKELVVIEATAEGIKKARETEVPEYQSISTSPMLPHGYIPALHTLSPSEWHLSRFFPGDNRNCSPRTTAHRPV